TGKFYYVQQDTSNPHVAVWDPATGANTVLSTVSLTGSVLRAAFRSDGVLFITAGAGDLYTINPTTGAAVFAGTLSAGGSPLPNPQGDMAFAPDGTLYLE